MCYCHLHRLDANSDDHAEAENVCVEKREREKKNRGSVKTTDSVDLQQTETNLSSCSQSCCR